MARLDDIGAVASDSAVVTFAGLGRGPDTAPRGARQPASDAGTGSIDEAKGTRPVGELDGDGPSDEPPPSRGRRRSGDVAGESRWPTPGRGRAPGKLDGARQHAERVDAVLGDEVGAPAQGGQPGRVRAGRDRECPSDAACSDPARDQPADPASVARAICLRLLTDRACTREELAQALGKRGVPTEIGAAVLDRFGEVGLVDDATFAAQWVRSRHEVRGLGRRAIAAELRRKGVDDEVAGKALAEVDPESEERRARQLVDRKLSAARGEVDESVARRILGMLARKGYPAGVAHRVVKEALAEHAADELAEQLPPGEDD